MLSVLNMICIHRMSGGECNMHGSDETAYTILVRKPERKRLLGRRIRRRKINIKIDHKEIRCMMWIEFIWLRIGSSGGG
jgi:hypothetical protein